jgi:transcriptional regulator with XRE-family HTH domain
LSLADIAERTGMDKGALSRLENGRFLNFTFATLARYARALGKRFALSLEDPTPKGVNPLAMKVNLDPAIQNNPQVAELIEHVNALLADELGTSAALTTATWMLLHDQGRPLYRLELKDAWGQASIDLASDQIEEPEHLRAALQRLRGNLLQCAASH